MFSDLVNVTLRIRGTYLENERSYTLQTQVEITLTVNPDERER